MKQFLLTLAAFTLAACSTAPGGLIVSDAPPREKPAKTLSGAYRALSDWGDSRAYPFKSIPAGTYGREVERLRLTGRSARGQGAGWQPLGPTNGGGRMLTVAFDPVDPGTIWAGAASGGLWRSTTGGVGADAWERIETGHPVLGVSTIAFAPDDPQTIYIGTGEVYNHMNAGELAADRATRGSYGIGILKSTDGGASWIKSLDWSYDQRRGVWAVRIDPFDSDVVWAATTEGVYKSIDAGASWQLSLGVVMAMDLVVHPTIPGTVLVGCGNLSSPGRGIYQTRNGGITWPQITGGDLPADFAGKIQFGVTPADPGLVYASIGNGFTSAGGASWLLRSFNFGLTWELRTTTDYSRYQGWFAHDVDISPTDGDDVVAVGIDVWTSSNGGTTLNRVTSWTAGFSGILPDGGPEGTDDYSHADHHDVVFHPTDPSIFYLANDGGIFRSTDGGLTYEGVNGGLQTQQFYNGTWSDPNDPNLWLGGLQDNSTVIYRGPGQWQRGVLGGDGGWGSIDPTDTDIVYASAQNLQIGKSLDGGDSFFFVFPPDLGGPVAFVAPFAMSPLDPQKLYTADSFLFRTVDGAGSWQVGNGGAAIDGNPILSLAIAPSDDDVVYVATTPFGGNRGGVYVTTDGGANFTDITGTIPDRFPGDMTVDPLDPSTVYLALSGFGTSHLFRSSDMGATWVDIDNGLLPDVPTIAVTVDPLLPDHLYVGNDIGVFFSPDAGASWQQLDAGLPQAVLIGDLGVSPAGRTLRAATHGQGLYERALPGGAGTIEATLLLDRVPGASEVTLSWGASCAGDADYAVYEGTLGDFTSHQSTQCSTSGALSSTLTPDGGDRYFLVVPQGLAFEGSHGTAGDGGERSQGPSACAARDVAC